ncbi:disease resistance protein (TIR-NBS-LRR class) [Artemisia annua]|uniref:Disease resistance protein (TIR-NBS-LRR class) n=1 Tax=Artemisia annua TaxID=35608 RepID=A0A2U1NJW6_ARTAN|nr:disease resistance protein (TIR-NBS-LRR class) [Artemisia annua]
MSFSRLLRFFSDHLSITSPNSSAPEKEESSSNSSAPKKDESSSNSSAPKIMVSTSTSSIALLGVMLMASSTFIYYFYSKASSSNSSEPTKEESSSNSSASEKEESSPNSSAPKVMASTSTTPIQKRFKYDVFLSFRGEDTRKNFLGHLYEALNAKGIYTYKDDVRIHKGKTISDELIKAIQDSKFYIIVFSKNYASSSWCLDELVKIMECQKMDEHTTYPVFYDVEPTQVRKQIGAVKNAFFKNKKKEAAQKWRDALKEAADLAGWELKSTSDGNEAEFIKKIVREILLELRPINSGFDEKLVGMETRVKGVVDSLKMEIDDVRMIGIKGMGGAGKTTTARAVFDRLSAGFEAKKFVENVREVSTKLGLNKLQEQVLSDVLNEHVTVDAVTDGKIMMKNRMCGIKVLLVLDDVNHRDQLEALAGGSNWFKPGSRIIVTTRDEQVLVAHRVKWIPDIHLLSDDQVLEAHRANVIHDIALLSEQEAITLFSTYAFGRKNPLKEFEKLSGKVVRYAAGLPLTLKVLGSSLCGKDEHEWKDAIERLKEFPLEETLKKLELSYESLEKDCKEIFLDIACILKGKSREAAIRILECCGFRAINGLKVLEQRSLITVNEDGFLGMHDHIEEMGKNIVHREHPNEPNKHSRLWIKEEIEDILANDKGTEATICLQLRNLNTNAGTVMKGLGKMKQLRYLQVYFPYLDYNERDAEDLDNAAQYFSNSLKYLNCANYPFLYLPKTFQANNLVGLDMHNGRMVQLWKDGEKKVLKKLKFLSLYESALTTFDFSMTPSLETLILSSDKLVKLCMPVSCQELKHLDISRSKLRTFDLGLTPNLEKFSLNKCADFEELHVSSACPNLKFLELGGKSRLRSLDLELFPNLEMLDLEGCADFEELHVSSACPNLKALKLRKSRLRSLDLELFPNLESLDLEGCADFEELHVSSACPNLKFLQVSKSRLRSLDLQLFPNLERLDLEGCDKLVEINAPVGCLRKLVYLNLGSCLRFSHFVVKKDSRSSASLRLVGKSLDLCRLHPNSNLPKFQFDCNYKENLPSSVGNIENLISFGLCACTDFKKFSDMICSLRCLSNLELECDIPEFPKDLGQLECLEELYVRSKKIKYLPDSICMLKRLKSIDVRDCSCLRKLPEGIGQLESLERLDLTATMIKHLPDSICELKHLTHLILHHCTLLEKLPENLGQLECLEELYVWSMKIEYLPDSICMLKRLKSLDVGNCFCLGKLPEDIGQLESLERLILSYTKIKHLPDSICMLKHLKYLKPSSWCSS